MADKATFVKSIEDVTPIAKPDAGFQLGQVQVEARCRGGEC
jgi:hypothetical protein